MIEQYFAAVRNLGDQVLAGQLPVMEAVAGLFADKAAEGKSLFITGCSHSSIFAQEVFYRAGGFMLMNPLFLPGMTLETPPVTRTTRFERISGLADAVLDESPVRKGDVLVIASISGRNVVPVEMALWARNRGVCTVALTSIPYAESVASRHPDGRKLHELCDYTLDVGCPPGDAVLEISGMSERMGPSSTVIGIMMMHAVIARTTELLRQAGFDAPVFVSSNLDGGDETNRKRLSRYGTQIHYLANSK
ncbi:SIS domain-containing protein [Cohnella caldifontis]|uniref:SIS domain-containing protein n=1 Tax=Cohnella caldifontis TaxID=3027471 RepID=UPI0023EABACE|nr:SIS domain-containing protein [Cohnella sp. YIM B05605]